MVDLDEYCCEGNCAKIHEAGSTENTCRAFILKSSECDQNFACTNIYDYDEIIALNE